MERRRQNYYTRRIADEGYKYRQKSIFIRVLGQNLYYASMDELPEDKHGKEYITRPVQAWHDEIFSYEWTSNHTTGTCKPGKECTHFTQVIKLKHSTIADLELYRTFDSNTSQYGHIFSVYSDRYNLLRSDYHTP